jgi:AcrR family transcriptional regulator
MSSLTHSASPSQLYYYFADKAELVEAVIDYQAEMIVDNQRHANLGSVKGLRAWRNLVVAVVTDTQAKGGCPLGSLAGQLAESDPEARALIAAGFEKWSTASAMGSERSMTTGSSRPTSTPTISPSLCSPRSKEDFSWPRRNGALVRSKLQSIPSSNLPCAD